MSILQCSLESLHMHTRAQGRICNHVPLAILLSNVLYLPSTTSPALWSPPGLGLVGLSVAQDIEFLRLCFQLLLYSILRVSVPPELAEGWGPLPSYFLLKQAQKPQTKILLRVTASQSKGTKRGACQTLQKLHFPPQETLRKSHSWCI